MKKLFLLVLMSGCSYQADFPNMEDALNDICKPTDGYLLRRDEDKTYILTGASDNLSSTDIAIMDVGLYCLGYVPYDIDIAISNDDAEQLISQPVNFFYFSGHGTHMGYIGTNDSMLEVNDKKYAATNVMISACSVLKYPDIIHADIADTVQYVMGYSDTAYDDTDNTIVMNMLKEMKKGNSIPMSFYLANKKSGALKDRWVIYQHTPTTMYEYSARNGKEFVE